MPGTTVFDRHESEVRSYCRSFPVVFERAAGHHLWDADGRQYVDLLSGAGSLNYGHNPPKIVKRVSEYLASGGPVQSLDLHTRAKAEFLHRFADEVLEPRGFVDHVMQFPGPAGTLAVEAALKLARKVTGRTNVVAFQGGFHGASLGSLAATSSPLLRNAAGTALPNVTITAFDDGTGSPDSLDALRTTCRNTPPAAVLLETVQGEGGLHTASAQWLKAVRQIADEVGALVIVDEVQAGCGRTGTFFSFEHVPDFDPDLICLSKSLSGMGLPMAMVVLKRQHDLWKPGEHNGTFRGHNLAFVAATAALDHWADPVFVARTPILGIAIRESLLEIATALPDGVVTLAGRGTMSGLRFADAEMAERVQAELFRASIIAERSGDGRVLKLLPPLTMSLPEWSEIAARIAEVTLDVARLRVPV
ncbi:diaminobutyrate--2-oxoglutarate transaminase [Lentzea sp. NPDC058450]|uniref:diaminobutyrate--2-oxoglutarate transaminase n=1 Tax=Lentzea sp. NPDC058450 TaxID=3346505 RepID=UPI0036618F2B